jgi:ubiquinone/menaquinone biosynthesis C-methylase UbiE
MATPHRDNTLHVKKIPNFVRCDAKHLPFKDESFEEAYASHLIEHFSDPSNVLKEMIRVSSDKITIIVPHRVARKRWLKYEQDEVHKQLFCARTMMQWLDDQKLAYQIEVIKHSFPNDVIPLVNLPWQIRVEIRKTD